MRKLATIREIDNIQPIDDADKIDLATVNGWNVVVAKDVDHKVGDLVVYCEIDSFLPIRNEFEFLRKSSYKKLVDGTEGFRLKTMKMRGVVSQGLILPLSVFEGYGFKNISVSKEEGFIRMKSEEFDEVDIYEFRLGDDVSKLLGIVKYDPPLPAQLVGTAKGYFPSFIPRTDEERLQNLENYNEIRNSGKNFYATEKLDGSSATFYINDGHFGVCSRNLELLEDETNTFWRVARETRIEEKIRSLGGNYAFQGELVGEGIQKNLYKIKGHRVEFFNIFNIDTQQRVKLDEMFEMLLNLEFPMVPLIPDFQLPSSVDELLKKAEEKSIINNKVEREGIVVRSYDQEISFKVISNKFLLKNE